MSERPYTVRQCCVVFMLAKMGYRATIACHHRSACVCVCVRACVRACVCVCV